MAACKIEGEASHSPLGDHLLERYSKDIVIQLSRPFIIGRAENKEGTGVPYVQEINDIVLSRVF